jgi:hypothetical protein
MDIQNSNQLLDYMFHTSHLPSPFWHHLMVRRPLKPAIAIFPNHVCFCLPSTSCTPLKSYGTEKPGSCESVAISGIFRVAI